MFQPGDIVKVKNIKADLCIGKERINHIKGKVLAVISVRTDPIYGRMYKLSRYDFEFQENTLEKVR